MTREMPPKEFYLLFKLLNNPNKTFTRLELLDEIWGMDSDTDEIKTPVSAMMGFAEMMLEDDIQPEEQKEYLSLIYDEAARISRLCEMNGSIECRSAAGMGTEMLVKVPK